MVTKTSTKIKSKKVKPKKSSTKIVIKNKFSSPVTKTALGALGLGTLGLLGYTTLKNKGNKNLQEQSVKINVNTDNKNEEFYKKTVEPLIKNLQNEINKLQENNKNLQDEIEKIHKLLDDNLKETDSKISKSINNRLTKNKYGQKIITT